MVRQVHAAAEERPRNVNLAPGFCASPHALLRAWHQPCADVRLHGRICLQANLAIEEAAAAGSLLHRHLRCHYAVLFVSMAVVAGRVTDLQSGKLN